MSCGCGSQSSCSSSCSCTTSCSCNCSCSSCSSSCTPTCNVTSWSQTLCYTVEGEDPVTFTRVFTLGCYGSPNTADYDQITGVPIVIPTGATVGLCA